MTQVIINIDNTEKWDELKPILESMDIAYVTHDTGTINKLSETELELLEKAKNDVKEGRIFNYVSHRDILSR